MSSFLFHPVTTFVGGVLLAVVGVGVLMVSCVPKNRSAEGVESYRRVSTKPASAGDEAAVERFTTFLKNIGSEDSIRRNTSKVYAADAYLNDTLATKHGAAEIEAYFLKTAKSMKSCEVSIDDVSKSGPNYYVRWTMVVTAAALSKGEPVHSIGITQVRFNGEGKVVLHQDFWDSSQAFFEHLPLSGPAIGFIRKRLE